VLLTIFISIFALDAFSQPRWLLAFLIHLIPTFILIALTIFAWKREKVGGVIYLIIGILLIVFSRFEAYIIALPLIIIGLLFILNGFFKNNKKKRGGNDY